MSAGSALCSLRGCVPHGLCPQDSWVEPRCCWCSWRLRRQASITFTPVATR